MSFRRRLINTMGLIRLRSAHHGPLSASTPKERLPVQTGNFKGGYMKRILLQQGMAGFTAKTNSLSASQTGERLRYYLERTQWRIGSLGVGLKNLRS